MYVSFLTLHYTCFLNPHNQFFVSLSTFSDKSMESNERIIWGSQHNIPFVITNVVTHAT